MYSICDKLRLLNLIICSLFSGCVASANKHVVALSEELARKVEDSLRQQEEISSLLGQVVDLQQRCKTVREAMLHIC